MSSSTSIRRGATPDSEIVSSPHKDVTTLEIATDSTNQKPPSGGLDEEKDKLLNSEPSASPSATTTAVPVTPSGSDAAMPYIAFWLCMSISVILFNKYLYNGVFSFPLTLTSSMTYLSLASLVNIVILTRTWVFALGMLIVTVEIPLPVDEVIAVGVLFPS